MTHPETRFATGFGVSPLCAPVSPILKAEMSFVRPSPIQNTKAGYPLHFEGG
ncbi:hypothetical protein [Desulfatibacillum aliphaticivorans]|uniref:Uncharacterized protein n=1 Tax=Desulfatibacillum aliphaticivorans TaxID=218208 RepID=B8FLM8_DESAL|nr:hypothetical protein [Desulfatibacillum aliphaticivorans]ACL05382.1 hypothetical protein Dalk_3694 [Desulfatibacillum aliphaticivorans]